MLTWAVVGLTLVVAAALVPVTLRCHFHLDGWRAGITLQVQVLRFRRERHLPVSEYLEIALEHMLKRWAVTGEPIKGPLQVTARRAPLRRMVRLLREPLRYLGRKAYVPRLHVEAEVGGGDAMQSALLTGAGWAAAGLYVSLFSRLVRIDPKVPAVTVRPGYDRPALQVRTDCILRWRLGNAMFGGVWAAARILRDPTVRAWVRDSLRRKGAEVE